MAVRPDHFDETFTLPDGQQIRFIDATGSQLVARAEFMARVSKRPAQQWLEMLTAYRDQLKAQEADWSRRHE